MYLFIYLFIHGLLNLAFTNSGSRYRMSTVSDKKCIIRSERQ